MAKKKASGAASVRVRVEFNKDALMEKIRAACAEGLEEMGNEALKDANFYARQDTGAMIASSIKASRIKGVRRGKNERPVVQLIWNTKYAKRVYYTGRPVTDANPNASLLWAHKGYAENFRKYEKILQDVAEKKV